MNRQQFSELVRDPLALTEESSIEIQGLLKQYPYCQTAQILFTLNLLQQNQASYPAQLKKAVAYAGDRKKLKEHLEGKPKQFTEVSPIVSPEAVHDTTPLAIQKEEVVKAGAPMLSLNKSSAVPKEKLSQNELLSIVRKRLLEIKEETNRKAIKVEADVHSEETDVGKPVLRNAAEFSIPKDQLIDRFIREEPQISRPKKEFFSPAVSSHRSNMDDEDIVSETLALLYAKQGNMQKAIHVYEKLSLRFSEKSRYFAAQIENLKGNNHQSL